MDDSTVAGFIGITDAPPHVAQYFLNLTGNDVMQAVGLFYDSPDLAANIPREDDTPAPSAQQSRNAAHDDSDDEEGAPAGEIEDDEAMARRLQEEMYRSAGVERDDDGVRAPIARRTETLVGPDADWAPEDMEVEQQMARIRQRQRGQAGIFRQSRVPGSIWNRDDPNAQRAALAQATSGASEQSSRSARLAEMYRAPYEIIHDLDWDEAKELGKTKDEEKWMLVNIQDSSIFDCQLLNRDIWRNPSVQDTVREKFVFVQWEKNDPAADQYIRHYFPRKDDMEAYPYIAIVDPRTGEQVKKWSGPPCPNVGEFLMELHDFLERYSLSLDAKNPVARRKVEPPKDVGRMTEEEMLAHAIQSSLQQGNGNAPSTKEEDPDELTKSIGDLNKGKGKEIETDDSMEVDEPSNGSTSNSAFSSISSTNPHIEPTPEKGVTGRIQFRHSNGRVIRSFRLDDPIRRIYEWLKAEPLEGRQNQVFELKYNGEDLLERLGETIKEVGLSGATVMIEYIED